MKAGSRHLGSIVALSVWWGTVACDSTRLCSNGACEIPAESEQPEAADASRPATPPALRDAANSDAEVADASLVDAGSTTEDRTCSSDTDCDGIGACHPELGACVACIAHEQCGGPTPICATRLNPLQNACVGCLADKDCRGGVCVDDLCAACDIESNRGCEGSLKCVNQLDGSPACVECGSDDHCTDSERPVCDEVTGRCEVCLTDGKGCSEVEHCVSDEPSEDSGIASRRCVECTAATAMPDCSTTKPFCVREQCVVCDPVLGEGCPTAQICVDGEELSTLVPDAGGELPSAACVQCRNDGDCERLGGPCVGGQCVQCRDDVDCSDPDASACDEATHTCVACTSSSQCKHIEGAKVCHSEYGTDGAIANSRCVACDAFDFRACDAAKSVCITIPVTGQFTCSTNKVNEIGFCGECLADADCSVGQRCVLQTAPSGQSGYYCLFLEGSENAPSSCAGTDAQPFVHAMVTTSVDGEAGTYCALDTASCDVFNRFKDQQCSKDADCGEPDDGAVCYPGPSPRRCSYECSGDVDCPRPDGHCVNALCEP